MKSKDEAASSESPRWTRPDDYLGALARRRTARRNREPRRGRTQPEAPRLLLSTLPFLALIAALGALAVAVMLAAWPTTGPPPRAQHEQGIAPRGWFQEAQKEFR